tara:strand:- start:2251 stop:3096 length:846 start_codon:yes stop_codon:yes gene_type:complete
MKKILITGASGFIGKSLVEEFKNDDFKIFCYSSKDGDIYLEDTWNKMPKANFLIHLAGKTFVPLSWENPKQFLDINSSSLFNAIKYCQKNNCKLVYLSSFIYGNKNMAIDEESKLSPQNPYALSKLIGENICNFYRRVDNLNVIILRPFNIFGRGQKESFLIPKLIKQIKNEDKIIVMDTKPKRDYLYIKDLTNAIKKSLSYKGKYHIFNIGSGISHSVEDVINILQKLFKTNLEVESTQEIRKMELNETIANIQLANRELGWSPEYTLESALREMTKTLV